ncbi:MAG: hypothetical protein ACRD1P_12440 [Thermoanaerobaculia bacterium]
MSDKRGARGEGRVGCVIWLGIVGLIAYGLVKIVPVKIANSSFEDFMTEQASFGSIKSVRAIEREILDKAKDLAIPVTKDNLTITKTKEKITIEAHYEVTIEFFGGAYKYVWKRDPVVERPLFVV